jgi:hypothetical protein
LIGRLYQLLAARHKAKGGIMDSTVIFAIVLAVLFFGAITWLIIHARLQERRRNETENQPSSVTEVELQKKGTN